MKRLLVSLGGLLILMLLLAAGVVGLNLRGEDPIGQAEPPAVLDAALVEQGRYLALAGNCASCHTERGGAPYAGGHAIPTPFGTVFASNLTPDEATGLGRWSADHFWRAMRNGRSRDGRLLYPAFPYAHYTLLTREDSDALYAWLRSLPPVRRANKPHELRFPVNTQAALAVWRALFFRPQRFEPDPSRDAAWNRGAYLVRGLGHCAACHAERNVLGATTGRFELGGGLMPVQNWYAPSLARADEASVADWPVEDIVALLRDGVSPRGSVLGPMAEVVFRSTQHLSESDLQAMAVYLRSLPQQPLPPAPPASEEGEEPPPPPPSRAVGQRLYEQHCVQCHGERGEGVPDAYPALAGNRTVTMASPANLVRILRHGGYPPATAGNPRPHGMPPYGHLFDDEEMAAVATYLRGAWGHQAAPVTALEVYRYR